MFDSGCPCALPCHATFSAACRFSFVAYVIVTRCFGCMQAHRSGLVQAVGFDSGVITCGNFGSITLWPEAELRAVAEAAGFILPPPAHAAKPKAALTGIDMSSVLHRYFTPGATPGVPVTPAQLLATASSTTSAQSAQPAVTAAQLLPTTSAQPTVTPALLLATTSAQAATPAEPREAGSSSSQASKLLHACICYGFA